MMSEKNDLIARIEIALSKIRPFLQKDDGDISLVGVTDDMVVQVEMLGACRTCTHIDQTLHAGVAQYIKREAPEIKEVVSL
jgi:Fe-S cluster biogenesis protein NfuA